MNTIAARLARLSITKPWVTVGIWVLLAVGITVAANVQGRDYTDSIAIPGSDSQQATQSLGALDEGGGSRLIIGSDTPLTERGASAAVDDLLETVSAALDVQLANPLDSPQRAAATGALAPDGTGVAVSIDIDPQSLSSAQKDAAIDAVEQAQERGLTAAFSGELARTLDAQPSHRSELIGLVAAVIVLSIALGSMVAMAVPIGAGALAVLSGLGLLGLTTHVTSIPEIAPTLATMIGLGVGIDYALFQVTRLRKELHRGVEPRQAVVNTASNAGAAAAFAGITVALSITALAISGVSYIAWLGYGSAIVVLVVVATALTLTPALLILLAPRLARTWGRKASRHDVGVRRRSLAETVVRHPWRTGVAAFVVLGTLATPAAFLSLGMSGPGDRAPSSQSRQSYDIRATHWGEGSNATLTVVVDLDSPAVSADDERLSALDAQLATVEAASVSALRPLPDNPLVATASVTPLHGANDSSTRELLEELRSLPGPDGTSIHVGGSTATRIDLATRVTQRLPWLMTAVVVASTLLLVVAFRSLLIPLKAAFMNGISVAASYGVMVAVFQWGWGAKLVGLDGPVAIDSFVPMILFTVLFGLSTDYEVFLISGMRETWDRTGDARQAIVEGMRSSGRVITTAAVIMIAVFISFVTQADPTIKIFGLGLATSILLDATIVRMLLVPAVMRLMGERAWWLPQALNRVLPRIGSHE